MSGAAIVAPWPEIPDAVGLLRVTFRVLTPVADGQPDVAWVGERDSGGRV